jgi:hypothetical protein
MQEVGELRQIMMAMMWPLLHPVIRVLFRPSRLFAQRQPAISRELNPYSVYAYSYVL